MSKITAEEWKEWKESKVTKAFMAALWELRVNIVNRCVDSPGMSPEEIKHHMGRAAGLDAAINAELETEE